MKSDTRLKSVFIYREIDVVKSAEKFKCCANRRNNEILVIVYLYCKFVEKPRLALDELHQRGMMGLTRREQDTETISYPVIVALLKTCEVCAKTFSRQPFSR